MTVLIKPTPSTNLVRGWSTAGAGHRGIDYGWQVSNPGETQKILAAADGTVIDAYTGSGFNGGWGRRIRIDHGHGNVTTYNHIRPGGVLVAAGTPVKAGQVIAYMGSSGAATGTHLHFELYLNGGRVDPALYFSKDLPGTGGEAASSGGAPVSGQKFSVPSEGQYYYWKYANALSGNFAPNQMLRGGQTLDVIDNPGTGPVQVRAADGDLVWVGTRNHPAVVNGGQAPAGKPQRLWYDTPSDGQYYYRNYSNALTGNFAPNQLIPASAGTLEVLDNPGTGPVKVNWNGTPVWVGTRNHPAAIRRG
jgi:Membrane proteins related to metalloendopeptidases